MKKIKTSTGNTGIDIVISLGLITITLGVLAALYFNTYIANTEIERRTQAINYASQIFEKISEYYYGDITETNLAITTNEEGNQEIAGIEILPPYTVALTIENYKSDAATDVVKNIIVNITYTIGNKNEELTLSRYKTKESVITPNAPELAENMVAVKVQKSGNTSSYKTTSIVDADWYNYFGRKWALAKENTSGSTITAADLYVWIPRYAYLTDSNGNTDIQFLYSNKNQIVGSYGVLQELTAGYTVDTTAFSGENARGYWVKISEIENDETANRLNNSEYGPLIY